jgi:ADP-ribose pyrophosphatase
MPTEKTNQAPIVLAEGKFLRLVKLGHWEYADRINVPGAVVIAAVTPEHKFLLVEQYRIPCGKPVIELPAGIAGDSTETANEALVEAARRELVEETGYAAGRMEQILTGPTSAGLTSELVTVFVAKDLRRVGKGGGEGSEEITVHEIPLEQAEDWLLAQAQSGKLVDHKVFVGLYFVQKR